MTHTWKLFTMPLPHICKNSPRDHWTSTSSTPCSTGWPTPTTGELLCLPQFLCLLRGATGLWSTPKALYSKSTEPFSVFQASKRDAVTTVQPGSKSVNRWGQRSVDKALAAFYRSTSPHFPFPLPLAVPTFQEACPCI